MFSLANILQIAQWRIQGRGQTRGGGASQGLDDRVFLTGRSGGSFTAAIVTHELLAFWLFLPRKMYEVFCHFRQPYQKTELTQLSLGRRPFFLAIECTVDVI